MSSSDFSKAARIAMQFALDASEPGTPPKRTRTAEKLENHQLFDRQENIFIVVTKEKEWIQALSPFRWDAN